jgi:hypothetical protein
MMNSEMHPCQSDEYAAVLAGAPLSVVADWLRENGEWAKADEVTTAVPFKPWDVNRFLQTFGSGSGSGIGIGRGSGSGRGRGRGSGSGIGSGSGSGIGIGRGSGIGIGRGIGIGIGIGSGSGSGRGEAFTQRNVMRVGKAYLMHQGDWHTFVGRVVEQTGPLTYAVTSLSKVDLEHIGDRWGDLAGGDEALRRDARYWHYKGEAILPLSIAAIEWVGPTPQEAGLTGRQ